MKSVDYDIIVVGGGPAGLSFACSLAGTGLHVLVIEKMSRTDLAAPEYDGRDIALTHLSMRILAELGVAQRIDAGAIARIREARVLDGTSPYVLSFGSSRGANDPLGCIVSNHLIRRAVYEQAEAVAGIELLTDSAVASVTTSKDDATVVLSSGDTITSALVVAADSRFSQTRRMMGIAAAMHDFGRVAIVCRMRHQKPHHDTAFECFQYGRTLAVLPLAGQQSSIVVTAPADVAAELQRLPADQFCEDVQARFEGRLGRMAPCSERFAYPLVAVHAKTFCANRFALIGDAAVGMHPVTAHGFNLGLRGQDTLARGIKRAVVQGQDIGAAHLLADYESKHMPITRALYRGTNAIVQLFTNDRLPQRVARSLVLRVSNRFPPVKWLVEAILSEPELLPAHRPSRRPSIRHDQPTSIN